MFLTIVTKQAQELTKFNPGRNIFSINVELTSTFLLYRGLVHHHHRILNLSLKSKFSHQTNVLTLPDVCSRGIPLALKRHVQKFSENAMAI